MSRIVFLMIPFLGFFLLACLKHQGDLPRVTRQIQHLSGTEVSRIDNDVTVTFSARLGRRFEENCVEVFIPDEYKKYDGDPKWAILSRFALDSAFAEQFESGTNGIVTGKMTFVRDSSDLRKSCNLVTGRIFDITEIDISK